MVAVAAAEAAEAAEAVAGGVGTAVAVEGTLTRGGVPGEPPLPELQTLGLIMQQGPPFTENNRSTFFRGIVGSKEWEFLFHIHKHNGPSLLVLRWYIFDGPF